MKASDLKASDVSFTHFDDVTNVQTTFAVSRLLEYCKTTNARVWLVPITPEDAAYIYANRGIELHRLRALDHFGTNDLDPVVFCKMPDDSYLLVDGSHRYVHLSRIGAAYIKAYMLQIDEWKPFVVEDAPPLGLDELMNRKSGL